MLYNQMYKYLQPSHVVRLEADHGEGKASVRS